MTEPNAEHPTSGRRGRYTVALPVPRLADHMDTENGPSDEESEKEAKRQRSEPTTPISTSSRLPYEHDEVMGITQVDPREADGFEEGLDLEHHDASENPNPRGIGKTVVLMHLRDQEDTGVDYSPRTLTCLTPQFG